MDELTGKVAVVTGGASGIGFGMAEAFAAEGMKVVLADIEAAALADAAGKLRAERRGRARRRHRRVGRGPGDRPRDHDLHATSAPRTSCATTRASAAAAG